MGGAGLRGRSGRAAARGRAGLRAKPFLGDELGAAATYLGLSESDLRTKLQAGQSLADVAKAQSKDLAGLEQAILDAAKADLDKAVAAKDLTQAQADDMLAKLKSRIADVANGTPRFRGPGGPGRPGHLGRPFGQDLAAAAKYLGLSESDLRSKLRAGQSLADVAKAQSKDASGLEDAIVAASKANLDQAVAAKKLTQSQADGILSGLKAHVADLVDAKPGAGPQRGARRGGRPRLFFGP